MMPAFYMCQEGVRFVAGACLVELQSYARETEGLSEFAESFLGLSRVLISLSPQDLFHIGGFAVALQPGQILEVPGGFVVAETGLTEKMVGIQWSSFRPSFTDWGKKIELCLEVLEADYRNLLVAAKPEASEKGAEELHLNRIWQQCIIGQHVLKWAQNRLEHACHSDWSKQKGLAQDLDVQSLDSSYNYFLLKKAFQKAVGDLLKVIAGRILSNETAVDIGTISYLHMGKPRSNELWRILVPAFQGSPLGEDKYLLDNLLTAKHILEAFIESSDPFEKGHNGTNEKRVEEETAPEKEKQKAPSAPAALQGGEQAEETAPEKEKKQEAPSALQGGEQVEETAQEKEKQDAPSAPAAAALQGGGGRRSRNRHQHQDQHQEH